MFFCYHCLTADWLVFFLFSLFKYRLAQYVFVYNFQFEQEQGEVSFERAVLYSNTRRPLAPRRRHLNGRKEYYRPNSTHQYLSATDLRNLHENEENMIKYGRPTRTTLLRARQRTNSAPVNAYDIRRENNKSKVLYHLRITKRGLNTALTLSKWNSVVDNNDCYMK